jgi:putative transcriptional regulator
MTSLPYSQITKGALLIANPEETGVYFRSVVLICEHSAGGSFGLIVNKPLDVELPDELLQSRGLQNRNVQMRMGGPIQPTHMVLVHTSDRIPEQTLKLCEGVYLGGDLQFLQESLTDSNGPAILLCFGYCGWGPGQLEREFLSGEWFLHPASKRHIFDMPPEKIWQTVLREMGGKYATLSMIPEDLSLN